jgi:hypothetical protein
MSRIGIIGSFRTSPVNTVLDWFAMFLPIEAFFLLLFPKPKCSRRFVSTKRCPQICPARGNRTNALDASTADTVQTGDGHFQ